MKHEIKLKEQFVIPILEGRKTFEIRLNDRAYQVGDTIAFIPVRQDGSDLMTIYADKIKRKQYEITYLLSGWGIEKDYVAFSFKERY